MKKRCVRLELVDEPYWDVNEKLKSSLGVIIVMNHRAPLAWWQEFILNEKAEALAMEFGAPWTAAR